MIRSIYRSTKGIRFQAYGKSPFAEKIYIGTYGTRREATFAIAAHAAKVAPERACAVRAALKRNLRRAEERVARIRAEIARLDARTP